MYYDVIDQTTTQMYSVNFDYLRIHCKIATTEQVAG